MSDHQAPFNPPTSPVWLAPLTDHGEPATIRRSGMGLAELLLCVAVVAMVLGGLVLISQSLRDEACEKQTRQTLRRLRAALHEYHLRHRGWPPGPTTDQAIRSLLADPATARMVGPLSLSTDDQGKARICDGYGQPVRYVIRSQGDANDADFVSAGPDGRFGDLASPQPSLRTEAADNLYGADLETPES